MRKRKQEAIQRETEEIIASLPQDIREGLEKSVEKAKPELEARLERHRKKYERFKISQRVRKLNRYIQVIGITSILTCTYFMM